MRAKELVERLTVLGFTASSARLYLAGLKTGPSLIAPLAREAGISRKSAYPLLEELGRRGFFLQKQVGKRTHYQAVSAKQLLKIVLNQEQLVRELLPFLDTMTASEQPRAKANIDTPLPFKL